MFHGDSKVDGAAFGSLVADDAKLTDVVVAGDADLGRVNIDGTFAADTVNLTDDIVLNDESSFTANEVTTDGYTIYFDSDVSVDVDLFKGDVKFFGDKMNVAGLLEVDGELDLTDVNALSGDVRVYGYSDNSSANPYEWVANQIKVSDIALDGNFEADITADDVAAIELSDTTRIERLNDELFNTKPYGSLNFNGATAPDEANKLTVNNQAVDGNYAFVEKGVMSEGNLDVIGNVEADFAVKGVMTLGEGAEYEDYVTLEDDAKPAANANIKGDVTADALVAAGAESVNTVTGNVDTYAVSVKKRPIPIRAY